MRLIVSDLHLGSFESQYQKLLPILQKADFDELYMLGDIFDLWVDEFVNIKRDCFDFFKVLDELITKGIIVNYYIGNHDRNIDLDDPIFDRINIKISNIKVISGKKVKLIHGDRYDYLMEHFYFTCKFCAWFWNLFGKECKMSFSSKKNTHKFKLLLDEVKKTAIKENSHADILIMGHTHVPDNMTSNGIRYINTGNWVGDNSYIIEDNGVFTLMKG